MLSLLLLAAPVTAHLAFWHPSMYNFDDDTNAYPFDASANVPFTEWWFHGNTNNPPNIPPSDYFPLPANGTAHAQLACKREFLSPNHANTRNACPDDIASLHEPSESQATKGTALAIAYNSDITTLTPSDFTVISTNKHSPWRRDTSYDMPDLPPCPEGGCHCLWGWIHGSGSEFYTVGFRCIVTGAREGARKVAKGKPPVQCKDQPWGCVAGPKQPIYWGVQGGNVDYLEGNPPFYNEEMGFWDGAQRDIFEDGEEVDFPELNKGVTVPPPPPPPKAKSKCKRAREGRFAAIAGRQ